MNASEKGNFPNKELSFSLFIYFFLEKNVFKVGVFQFSADLRLKYSHDYSKNVERCQMTAQFRGMNHVTLSPQGYVRFVPFYCVTG